MKARSWAVAWSMVFVAGAPLGADAQWMPNGRVLCAAPNGQGTPTSVPDGLGGAIVAWRDTRNAATAGDIFATRVTRAGGVGLWPASGVSLCTAAGDQLVPEAAPDGEGGAIVTWQDSRLSAFGDVFATRVLGNGFVHPSWPQNGVAICTAAQAQTAPVIAADNSGGAFIAWRDFRNGVDGNIFVQHVLQGGMVDPLWPADGLAVCTASGNQRNVKIVADGAGGAILVWEDDRDFATNNFDIYVLRVTGGGALLWMANGSGLVRRTGSAGEPNDCGR